MHSLFAIFEVRHSDAAFTELFDTVAPFIVIRIRNILGSQFSGSRERAEILPTFPRVSGDADSRIQSSNHCNSASVFLLNIKFLDGKRVSAQAAEMSREFPASRQRSPPRGRSLAGQRGDTLDAFSGGHFRGTTFRCSIFWKTVR